MYACLSDDPHGVCFQCQKIPSHYSHFGLAETKVKVDLMEDEYDRPMLFKPDLVPDPAVAGESVGAWGQGVDVFGAARGYKRPSYYAHIVGKHAGV